ncbi:MAG: PAS domain S-box protein [Nitrospirota bacterium]|nr:PAS domain S-box protein [Nitrospirota bacterium]
MTIARVTVPPPPAILIVDDDPDIALVLHDLLEHAGYRVQVAGTGAEALTKFKEEAFAVVLLDLMLPDMDGLSVLTLLKELDPVLPVIMLTAFVEVAKKYGSLTEGAFGYLTKPYDAEELKALIRRAVGVKHLSIEAAAAKEALTASEDRFREVVQTAPDAIVLADEEGHILSWNSAAERLFGYADEEVLGQFLTTIMPERYRPDHQRALERVRATGDVRLKGVVVNLHGLHKSGREFPIEMSLSSWISGGQRVYCGIVRDITARKEAEARLLQQQIEQQVLLDLIPAMVWYKDSHNRILRANRCAAESINKTVGEIEGRPTHEFYPDEAEKYHQDDLEVIVSGQPKLGIVEPYQSGTGQKRWVQTDKVPYLDPQGNILGVLVFAQDITERRRVEEALRESEERLRVVVESALNGIVMVDPSGQILLANARLETQFGYEAGELLGQSVDQLIPSRLRARHPEHRSAFLAHPETASLSNRRDLVGLRKDGTEFPLAIQLTPMTTANGVYVVASVSDFHGLA